MPRYELYDQEGNLLEVQDDRALDDEKSQKVLELKAKMTEEILTAYPEYKQINAALGVYDSVETKRVVDGIKRLRQAGNQKEAQILACKTLDDIDALFTM